MRFERNVEQPRKGGDENDNSWPAAQQPQVTRLKRVAHRTGCQKEEAQPHRAAAIAPAQTQVAQGQQPGDRNRERGAHAAHDETDTLA